MAYTQQPHSPATTITSLSDERRHVLSYLPPDTKLIAIAPARIYHSPFGAAADAWTSTGLRGMLVFGRNRITVYPDRPLGVGEGTSVEQNYWFRLVDVDSGRGIVWFHPIPLDLDYHSDKPFFHTFSGCSRMFGFRFDEDSDAEKFRRRVTSRIQITPSRLARSRTTGTKRVHTPSPPSASSSLPPPYSCTDSSNPAAHPVPTAPAAAANTTPRKLSPSMISAPTPGTFVHVAHVGVDADGRIETTPNVEPGWTMILEELHGYGVTEKMIREDFDFVEGFLAGAKASLVKELELTPPTPTAPMPPFVTETVPRTPTPAPGAKVRRAQTERARLVQRKRVPGHF